MHARTKGLDISNSHKVLKHAISPPPSFISLQESKNLFRLIQEDNKLIMKNTVTCTIRSISDTVKSRRNSKLLEI